MQPNILAEGDKFFIRSRTVSWLLSGCSGLETLVVFDLDLYDNTDVRRLTDSIARCKNLQSVELRRMNVGVKIDSTSSFFEALVAMKMRHVTIELGSIVGGEQTLGEHSAAGLAALLSGGDELSRSEFVRNGEYHLISNNQAMLDEVEPDSEESKRGGHGGDIEDMPQETDKSEL